MVKINYIIREENKGQLISEDAMLDALDIEEILEKNYKYILDSMKNTHYLLTVNHCTYFKEIVFSKKVVGFCAYTIINSISNLSLVACYILPEFRGKGLFFDEINRVFESENELTIYQPPRYVMELLIKYGFAKKISENLAVTAIDINIASNSIEKIFNAEKILYEDFVYTSNIYDLDSCGFLIFPEKDSKIIYLTDVLNVDSKVYDPQKTRENITEDYADNILTTLEENKEEIDTFINNIKRNSTKNTEYDRKEEDVDFEDLKKSIQKSTQTNDLIENFEKIEYEKNSLFDKNSIDKEKYLLAYQNVSIYDFLNVFKDNRNIELTNSIINIDHEFTKDYIKNLVLKEGYITNEMEKREFQEYLNSLTVNEMKSILKNNNLTVTGNKPELIERISDYIPSNNVVDCAYHISEKGSKFIEDHEEIDFYNLYMKNFYYYEFQDYLISHDGPIDEISTKFLNEHIVRSVEKKDNKEYTDSLNALALINELNNNSDKGLYYELKKFIIGLNPIFLDKKLYNYYHPISKNNIDNIELLLFKSKLKLDEEFVKAWQDMEINNFHVPFEKALSILNKMLSGEDRDYMNDKIREEYLTQDSINHDKLDKSVQSTLDKYLNWY